MYCSIFKNARYTSILSNLVSKPSYLNATCNILLLSTKEPEQLSDSGSLQSENIRKKTKIIPKITLISQDDSVQITTFEEAQKLSKRRDLKLVKIVDLDTKAQRPIYKLMSGSEYLAEDLKQRAKRKLEKGASMRGEKLLTMNSTIAEHDLKVQVNKILKWIDKKYEVRIVVNSVASNKEKAENVYRFLENEIGKNGRIVQKRIKENDMKFQVLPPKNNKENLENS